MLEKLKKAISISRPVFWLGPMLVYLAGLFMAGIPRGPLETAEMLLLTFPFAFIIYGLNDLFDIEVDKSSPRKGGLWGARLEKRDIPWVKSLIMLFSLAIILVSALSFQPLHFAFSFLMIAVPYMYSAPPFRFKARPFWDSFLSGGYGVGPFMFAYTLSGEFFPYAELFVVSAGFSAIHSIATIMDYKEDKKAGITTFAVGYGPRAPALLVVLICLVNFVLSWGYSYLLSAGIALGGILSIWLAFRPTPKNAKTVFKILLAFAFFWIFYFFIKYFILGAWFADYSEMEFRTILPELLNYVRQ
ncbi:hypothetical protein GF412_04325 [Candidatus Micrarchaeota archaeon]|nr:hypothetical protein [Candidatus Micrarchaeota archaeon]MBD3418177.1 hypothetical protein [Candidatus Micrarchaeota archaeon]